MAGEKNRYSTIEKLWKLDDEMLKTPKHDELVLWLLNKNHFFSVFPLIHPKTEFNAYGCGNEEIQGIYTHLGVDKFWEFLKKKEYYEDIPDTSQDFWFALMQEYHELISDWDMFFLMWRTGDMR